MAQSKKEQPKVDGEYLCTIKSSYGENYTSTEYYSKNLVKVDDLAFADKKRKKDKSGWYNYDSEWGYYETTNVVAWMELPKPYKEEL